MSNYLKIKTNCVGDFEIIIRVSFDNLAMVWKPLKNGLQTYEGLLIHNQHKSLVFFPKKRVKNIIVSAVQIQLSGHFHQ